MQHFANKHVLITGGSEGLGLALAKQLVAQGARVSLVARTKSKLEAAATAVTAGNQSSQVSCHPADVTKYQEVVQAVQAAEATHGPIDVLICCAGAADLGYFHECAVSVYQQQMELNYMGSLHAVKAVYDDMVSRNSGHICFIASTLSLLGMIGYSAYCPSKFAVRGLAESLRNELQGSKVKVSIAYPADISTPGYAKENLNKPWESAKLSEGKLFTPDKVAADLLRGMAHGDFILPNSSFLIGLLQTITAGLVPRRLITMLGQVVLGAVSPIICSIVAAEHDGVARQGAAKRFARLWAAGQAAGAGQAPVNQ